MEYSEVQNIAKETIEYIKKVIEPGMKLTKVRELCEIKMKELGADSFWYWDIGAFCFAGNETTVSVSGRRYQISERLIETNDIVTIDLSPQVNHIWGDYARTIIIQDGKVVLTIEEIYNEEWKNGLLMEQKLHNEMMRFVDEDTTFENLYVHINKYIIQMGYVNLDFAGNLGHSIVKDKADRVYIENGNTLKLSEVPMFTFEPHISVPDSCYGYKQEEIYVFHQGKVKRL